MKRIGIIANCRKERAADVLQRLAGKAKDLGLDLFADEPTVRLLKHGKTVKPDEMFDRVDAVMALGGDGTMLRAVRALDGRDKPVIGVNMGGLGFLTSVAEEKLDHALECLAADDYLVSVRAIAESVVERNGAEIAQYWALNDVVVSNGPSSRVVTLDVSIDSDTVTSYVCDGLIVSTPTGSTGHSLSSGGPILSPETQAFVISLICPHTLSSRPLVVPDKSLILIRVANSAGDLLLSVDGQVGQPLVHGDCVRVSRSDRSVRFLHLPGHSYFAVLRQKLHWSGSNV